MHLGRERVICCWQLGDVLVDPGSGSCLPTLLEALGDERPRALLLAHVHLAHDGASGSLVRRWPEIEVHEHERAARHLVDPSRLLEIARLAVRRGHGSPVARVPAGSRVTTASPVRR